MTGHDQGIDRLLIAWDSHLAAVVNLLDELGSPVGPCTGIEDGDTTENVLAAIRKLKED